MSGKVLKVRGRMQIGYGSDEYVRIDLIDEESSVHFATAKLSPASWGLAVGTRSVECEIEVRALDRVGMIREWKTVPVPADTTDLSPWEVDGWRGRYEDLKNMHRYSGTDRTRAVLFERHVDRPTLKAAERELPVRARKERT